MKALVIGATGLVGRQLMELLVRDERFDEIAVFTRHNTGFDDLKVTEHHIDFGDPATWRELMRGDVLFSCLGTTRKEAGDKFGQYEVDYTYQYNFAAAASGNGVGSYVLVSAAGADSDSMFFYPRIKGELEDNVVKLPFRNISILRPTQLYGEREEKRPQEELALSAVRMLNKFGLMRGNRPVNARTVAAAMVELGVYGRGKMVYDVENIRRMSAAYSDYMIGENPHAEVVALTEI